MRLDLFLVKKGFFESRNKAAEAIKKRDILVDGKVVQKASFDIDDENRLEVLKRYTYVSRAGDKLKEFLKTKKIVIDSKECIDVGSSTGGFAEVLLEFGAKSVTCVDVGKDQLHPKIREDGRVKVVEECDIREFASDKKYDLLTCDVSFIGIEKILDKLTALCDKKMIILFKPQFEVGKDVKRDKKGVIKDKFAIDRALMRFESLLVEKGLKVITKEESKVKGKEGNVEYFYELEKGVVS